MFKRKDKSINVNKDFTQIEYNNVVEIWLTPTHNKTEFIVKLFYNEDDRYVKASIKTMFENEIIQYIQELKDNNIKLHRLEIPGRIMYRNTKLYYKIFSKG